MNQTKEEILKEYEDTIERGYAQLEGEAFIVCKNNECWDKEDLKEWIICG